MPKISVIVPVYKVEAYLSRCVESILSQTFPDFELILVDDGSPDRCGIMCDEYAAKDSRIHVVHRENGGLSAARNSGIEWMLKNSDSEYLTFVDSDDWVHPQYLERLNDAVAHHSVKAAVAKHRYSEQFDTGAMVLTDTAPANLQMDAQTLLTDHTWFFNYAWSKLYHRSLFETLRYPEGKNFEDTFTTYLALFGAGDVVLVEAELYFYFHNAEGISHAPWNEKELVIFEGMQAQLDFYRENGYSRAYEKEEWLYVNHYAYQLVRIRENRAEWPKNKPIWQKLRREMLAQMKASDGKYTFKTMPQCYAAIHPHIAGARALAERFAQAWKRHGFAGLMNKVKEKLGG